jgi:hypothetical protein
MTQIVGNVVGDVQQFTVPCHHDEKTAQRMTTVVQPCESSGFSRIKEKKFQKLRIKIFEFILIS